MQLDPEKTTAFQCAHCEKACIAPVKESKSRSMNGFSMEHFQYHATADEYDDTEIHAFALQLVCPNCKAATFAVGRIAAIPEYSDHLREYSTTWEPHYFYPPVQIVPIPQTLSATVKQQIMNSFALYFCDPTAAANSLRKAAEAFLSEIGIPQREYNRFVALAERISRFKKSHKELGELLSAIRWLGNDGSHHGDAVSQEELDDGYKIFFHVLREYFQPADVSVKESAHRIMKGRPA